MAIPNFADMPQKNKPQNKDYLCKWLEAMKTDLKNSFYYERTNVISLSNRVFTLRTSFQFF